MTPEQHEQAQEASRRPAIDVADYVKRRDEAERERVEAVARQEMAWYRSYVELWGVMRGMATFSRKHPWLVWLLLALGYIPWMLWAVRRL